MYNVKLTIVFILFSIGVLAQLPKDSELFLSLKKQDSIFFERSFNQCDSLYTVQSITDRLMFYHDQGGIQNKKIFLDNTKKYLCADPLKKPIRKLVEGTLEAYPLYNNGTLYGAIQHGVHDFFIREPEKEDVKTSTAKFTSVWLLESDQWKLDCVLSYDHQP